MHPKDGDGFYPRVYNHVLWPAVARDCLPSPTMFLALCSLLTLLGGVKAQSPTLLSSSIEPPASSVVSSSSYLSPEFSSLSPEPSSTSLGSSSTSLPPSLTSLEPPVATSGFSLIGDVLKPSITSYTFESLPAPSESSIPGVFPETYPDNPPPVGDWAVPNFGPAWAAAYTKARATVSAFLAPPLLLPFKYSRVRVLLAGSGFDPRGKSQYHHRCRLGERPMCWEHPASWRFPWSLFGCTFPAFSLGCFLPILKALVGLPARSKVCRLCHCLPSRDKRRCDVSFRFSFTLPALFHIECRWNRKLMRERGKAMGSEFVGKGVNIALGPDMNIARVPQGVIIKDGKKHKAC